MTKRKTSDKFEFDHICKMSDATSIVSKYYGRKGAMGLPGGKGEHYSPSFWATWYSEKIGDDIAHIEWHKEKLIISISIENLYWARYENKTINQATHDKEEAKAYQLAGELMAAGFDVQYN